VSQGIDLVRKSLPSSKQLILEAVEQTADGIVFRVRAKRLPRCPACFESRVSYHSRYVRRMRDLPWQGTGVEIHLQTRRFRCRNEQCASEDLCRTAPRRCGSEGTGDHATFRDLGIVGYAVGGLPGERLLHRLGISSSDDTVLRRVKARRRAASQLPFDKPANIVVSLAGISGLSSGFPSDL
jgi:transposase